MRWRWGVIAVEAVCQQLCLHPHESQWIAILACSSAVMRIGCDVEACLKSQEIGFSSENYPKADFPLRDFPLVSAEEYQALLR